MVLVKYIYVEKTSAKEALFFVLWVYNEWKTTNYDHGIFHNEKLLYITPHMHVIKRKHKKKVSNPCLFHASYLFLSKNNFLFLFFFYHYADLNVVRHKKRNLNPQKKRIEFQRLYIKEKESFLFVMCVFLKKFVFLEEIMQLLRMCLFMILNLFFSYTFFFLCFGFKCHKNVQWILKTSIKKFIGKIIVGKFFTTRQQSGWKINKKKWENIYV